MHLGRHKSLINVSMATHTNNASSWEGLEIKVILRYMANSRLDLSLKYTKPSQTQTKQNETNIIQRKKERLLQDNASVEEELLQAYVEYKPHSVPKYMWLTLVPSLVEQDEERD